MNSNTVLQELRNRIPEFQFDESYSSDLHTVFAFFTGFLEDRLKDGTMDQSNILKRSFDLINEMADSDDTALHDVLGTTIFIGLFDEFKSDEPFKMFLSEKAKREF